MIRVFKTTDGKVQQIHQNLETDMIEKDCWVAVTKPSLDELKMISSRYQIDLDDLKTALDEEERSRIVTEDNYTMMVLDIPVTEEKKNKEYLYTIPLAIIVKEDSLLTVCLEDTPVLTAFMDGRVRGFDTLNKSRAIYHMLYRNATMFLQYLRIIHKKSDDLEKKLRESQHNQELMDMLELKKSLVYITTSLRGNQSVLEKLLKNNASSHSLEDQELLEDVIVENKQAIEMAKTYSDIMGDTMNAFASVISNNLNGMLKYFATAYIVLMIPLIISNLFGMNVAGIPMAGSAAGFMIITLILVLVSVICYFIIGKNKKLK